MRRTVTTRKTEPTPKQPTSTDTITGTVSSVYFTNSELTIGKINPNVGSSINFRVPAVVMVGDVVTLCGEYTTHAKYGRQFNGTSAITQLPIDMAGLERYLSTSPRFNGIGPVKAKLLIYTFGETLPDVLANHPEQIAEAIHITLEQAAVISANWGISSGLNPLFTWLSAFGLTQHQCAKIIERLGGTAKAQLTTDPYILMDIIDRFGFSVTDGIALKMGIDKEDPQRIQRCILHVLAAHSGDGHTWMEEKPLYAEAERLLFLDCKEPKREIATQLKALYTDKKMMAKVVNFSPDGTPEKDQRLEYVYGLPHLYNYEWSILDICRRYGGYVAYKDDILKIDGMNNLQCTAYDCIMTYQISILTGSAGTGKGYVIDKACQQMESRGMSILLAAPTGKAAKRMEQQSSNPLRTASTIHRLLAYNPFDSSWGHNERNPLTADVVIVDEISMLDAELAYRLFTAIDFTKTRLILAGDENQIPSVGPGNILHDLIAASLCPCVRLTEVMRQSGILEQNATNILKASKIATSCDKLPLVQNYDDIRYPPGCPCTTIRPWTLALMDDPQDIIDTLCWLLMVKLPEAGYGYNDIQILTPQNKGPLGTMAINRHIQCVRHSLDAPSTSTHTVYAGDRVMQTRNNYDREIFNGTTGIVCEAQFGSVGIKWDGKEQIETYKAGEADLADVQLAYATTVHKAQGSEYPIVIVIVNRAHRFMNHRNLVYTAVTRASKAAIIIGDNIGIKSAMSKTNANQRDTWLGVLARQEQIPNTA